MLAKFPLTGSDLATICSNDRFVTLSLDYSIWVVLASIYASAL
jgi:hypothetical protein